MFSSKSKIRIASLILLFSFVFCNIASFAYATDTSPSTGSTSQGGTPPATDSGSGSTSSGSSTTPAARITKPPVIPQISTLPGPSGTDVSDANKYLTVEFLPNLTMTIIKIAIPLTVVFLIFGAIQFLTAYGAEEKLTNAKKTITWALIGLVISLLAYAIVQLIFFSGYQITTIQ